MRRKRTVNIFGLSFLDVMFCGFGSVILLVVIVNADTVERRDEAHHDLRRVAARLERELVESQRHLSSLEHTLASTDQELTVTVAQADRLSKAVQQTGQALGRLEDEAQTAEGQVGALKSELKDLDRRSRRTRTEAEASRRSGSKVRRFVGEGDRQYLTGLKIAGKRIMVLVDISASMLDETIVNVVRMKNMPAAERRRTRKWGKVLATVEWIVSQLPPSSRYQVYTFDTQARPALATSKGQWLAALDGKTLDRVVAALKRVAPIGGTSLFHAFEEVGRLQPPPDNLILLTDGLPTQGARTPVSATASGRQRVAHFNAAVEKLPLDVPVNTILFPMEGDPGAAPAFWKLAVATRGSFMSPSKDWP